MDTTFAYQCLHHKTYAQYLRYETYKTAYVIHPIGAAIKEFGIVLDGCLKAEKYTVNGDDVFCAYFEDNDIFPEFLYFTGNKIYSRMSIFPSPDLRQSGPILSMYPALP